LRSNGPGSLGGLKSDQRFRSTNAFSVALYLLNVGNVTDGVPPADEGFSGYTICSGSSNSCNIRRRLTPRCGIKGEFLRSIETVVAGAQERRTRAVTKAKTKQTAKVRPDVEEPATAATES
jgi:hypothetical protein